MTLQASYVRSLFANLENGRQDAFFEHVAEDVSWTVMGTHPLAGTYHTKADFVAHTFARLNKLLKEGVVLRVTGILVDGDTAAVEMESLSTALNGKPFDNRYCWVARFSDGTIVEVRAYLDSALVQRVIGERNEGAIVSLVLRFAGISEEEMSEESRDLLEASDPTVAPLVGPGEVGRGEVHLRVTSRGPTRAKAEDKIGPVAEEILSRLGEYRLRDHN